MKKVFALVAVVVIMLVGGIACATAPKMELPEGLMTEGGVVPGMGEHWFNPAQMPLGPIYLVYEGEVIGVEYMWSEDMMQDVSIPTPAGPVEFKALVPLPVGVVVDHATVTLMPLGHEGFEVPHSDIHMYFITQTEVAAITPGG